METVKEVKFRSNSDYAADWVNGKLQFLFRDGRVIVFDPAEVHADNRARAEQHGWEQRLADSMALEFAKIADRGERSKAKRERLERLIEHYRSGSSEWNVARAAGAGGGSRFDPGLVVQALAQVRGWSVEKADARVAVLAMTKEVERDELLKTLASEPKIAAEMAAIKAARAKPAVDASALLDALM